MKVTGSHVNAQTTVQEEMVTTYH